jgi:hypothetical protein
VAHFVVTRLFRQQSTWELENLLFQWQMHMPGIGDMYEVSERMLRGIAVPVDAGMYRYVPIESVLSMDPTLAWTHLWSIREQWTMEQLKPYLQAMELETGIATSELVAQHARLFSQDTTEGDHLPVYVAR